MAHTDDVGGSGSFAEHRDHWIARHQVDDCEGQCHHPKRDWQQCEQAPDQIFFHRLTVSALRRCRNRSA